MEIYGQWLADPRCGRARGDGETRFAGINGRVLPQIEAGRAEADNRNDQPNEQESNEKQILQRGGLFSGHAIGRDCPARHG